MKIFFLTELFDEDRTVSFIFGNPSDRTRLHGMAVSLPPFVGPAPVSLPNLTKVESGSNVTVIFCNFLFQ